MLDDDLLAKLKRKDWRDPELKGTLGKMLQELNTDPHRAARCFSSEVHIIDQEMRLRLQPMPESFVCPIPTSTLQFCTQMASKDLGLQVGEWLQVKPGSVDGWEHSYSFRLQRCTWATPQYAAPPEEVEFASNNMGGILMRDKTVRKLR